MAGKHVTWLLAAGLSLTAGCATSGLTESVSRATASLNPWKSRPAVSKEMLEAQRTLKNPEETLVCYARMKEDNQDFAEARERYREILVAYPENVDAALGMARIERSTGRYSQAHEILSGLASRNPRNIQVQLELGRTFAGEQEWGGAVKAFEEAVRIEPEDQTCRFELGLALARANRINEALPHLTFAVGTSAAMYNIGYVFQERGQTADAVQWYQEALASHPDPKTRQMTATMLAQLGARSAESASRFASRSSQPADTAQAAALSPAAVPAGPAADRLISSEGNPPEHRRHRDVAELATRLPAGPAAGSGVTSASRSLAQLAAPDPPSAPPQTGVPAQTGAPPQTGVRAVRPVSFSNPIPRLPDDSLAPAGVAAVPVPPWTGPSAARLHLPDSVAPPAQRSAAPVMDVPQWKARQ